MTHPATLAELLEQQTARAIAAAVEEKTAELRNRIDVLEHSLDAVSSASFALDAKHQRAVRWAWGYRRERNQQQVAIYRLINRSTEAVIAENRKTVAAEAQAVAFRAALARLVKHYQPTHYHGGKRSDDTCLWCVARAALESHP